MLGDSSMFTVGLRMKKGQRFFTDPSKDPPIFYRLHAHAACVIRRTTILGLDLFSDHCFSRDQETSNRRCILKRGSHDLSRVNDASFNHIDKLFLLSVEAGCRRFAFEQTVHDRRSLNARVL